MINANELRIGNWISQNGKTFQVDEIRHWYFSDAEPIPLTTEILEQCGFEKDKSNDVFEREVYSIQVSNNTSLYFDAHKDWMRDDKYLEWYLSHEWNNNNFKNEFRNAPDYLHQLQNLYFALTGEELTIKL